MVISVAMVTLWPYLAPVAMFVENQAEPSLNRLTTLFRHFYNVQTALQHMFDLSPFHYVIFILSCDAFFNKYQKSLSRQFHVSIFYLHTYPLAHPTPQLTPLLTRYFFNADHINMSLPAARSYQT